MKPEPIEDLWRYSPAGEARSDIAACIASHTPFAVWRASVAITTAERATLERLALFVPGIDLALMRRDEYLEWFDKFVSELPAEIRLRNSGNGNPPNAEDETRSLTPSTLDAKAWLWTRTEETPPSRIKYVALGGKFKPQQ